MTTTTTLGQLVAALFSQYEHEYADAEVAAVATQVRLADLMRAQRSPAPARRAPAPTPARRRAA